MFTLANKSYRSMKKMKKYSRPSKPAPMAISSKKQPPASSWMLSGNYTKAGLP